MIMNSKCRGCFRDLPENCVDRISILAAYKSQYNLSTIIFESVGLKVNWVYNNLAGIFVHFAVS